MRGKLFVVSGPSGVGKNTLLNAVVARSVHVRYSISATSRAMRPGEVDGKSYYFVTREQFEKLIADDALLEYAEYVGNYYGTPLQPIREAIEAGTDIVMDVDVVGALKIKKRLPGAVLVFIAAPSFDALRQRLGHRGLSHRAGQHHLEWYGSQWPGCYGRPAETGQRQPQRWDEIHRGLWPHGGCGGQHYQQ